MKPQDLAEAPFKITLSLRIRFFFRKWSIRTVRAGLWIGQKTRCPWLVFAMMDIQRKNGWRFIR